LSTDGIQGHSVRGEHSRCKHLDPVRHLVSWKVCNVVRNDRAGACDDGGGNEMFVIGIWKTISAFQAFPPVYLGVVKSPAHVLDQVTRAFVGLALAFTSPDQLLGFLILQLREDYIAPNRPIHALGCE
jgi:hypothetical protein